MRTLLIIITLLLANSVNAEVCPVESELNFVRKGQFLYSQTPSAKLEISGSIIELCLTTEAESANIIIKNQNGEIVRECRTTIEPGECCEPIIIESSSQMPPITIESSSAIDVSYEVRGCSVE